MSVVQFPSMAFPTKFYSVHIESIFSAWVQAGRPPIVRFFMREVFRSPLPACSPAPEQERVIVVSARCETVRGVMRCQAATADDLRLAQEWEQRNRDYDKADFDWHPGL